jgi:hypothetical protein
MPERTGGVRKHAAESVLERNAGRDIRFIGHSAVRNAGCFRPGKYAGLARMRNLPTASDIVIKDTMMWLAFTLEPTMRKES